MKTIADLSLEGKRVLVRQDLNVPIKDGVVTSYARIAAALPTLRLLLNSGAKVAVMSHLGRPEEGFSDSAYSLAPVAEALSERLDRDVPLIPDWIDGFAQPSNLVLLENVRFLKGELSDDERLARKIASLCDVFVMDAFGTSHRVQASTYGVGRFAKEVAVGPLMAAELHALGKAVALPERPAVAVVGGSKLSTKLNILIELAKQVDHIVVGGGIANTFLAAAGFRIGKSLMEVAFIERAKSLMASVDIPLPTDVVVACEISPNATATIKATSEVGDDDIILDVGPETQSTYEPMMATVKTIIWNGPVGVFEFPQFEAGTKALSHAIAKSGGYSLAGGGDTIAAINQFKIMDQISYISTGGGAFLQFMEGRELPAVAMLEARS